MSRVRVMHVLDRLGLAGTEYGVIKVVNALDPQRFEPSLCCLRVAYPHARALLRPDIAVHELRRQPGRDYLLVLRLARLLRRERVQVVHSHNWSTLFYTAVAAMLAGTPVRIHGEHGREAEQPPGGWRRRAAQRWLGRWFHHLTAVSRDIARDLTANWGINPQRITFVPNGVDLGRFGAADRAAEIRRELGVDASAPLIGSIGGFRPVKDHATLLRAFALVLERHPDARLLLAGSDSEESVAPRLKQQLAEWGIPTHSVLFVGKRQDVPDLLSAMDVYVNSSVYEGMSNTILEAMASRRPVVATAVGGSPDLVVDGVTGWLVPPRDPSALGARVGSLLEDPDGARAMGLQGRARVEERHRYGAMVDAYATLYETLLRRKERRWRPADVAKRSFGWGAEVTGLWRIAGVLNRPRLTILSYHRVLPLAEKERTACQGMIVPTDVFERQVAALAARYRPLSLEEVRRHFRDGRPFPERAVWVTFDDGYADNYTNALPVLRHHGVPATFFLTTGPIDSGAALWWDDLADSLRAIHAADPAAFRDRALAEAPAGIRGNMEELARAPEVTVARIDHLVRELNRVDEGVRQGFVDSLRRCAEQLGGTPRPRLMLTWNQVREMRTAGMDFGGHTVHHRFLDTLNEKEAVAEVEESMRRITAETGLVPVAFSYPRGRSNAAVRAWLAGCGVELGVTTEMGVNDLATDPLALRRRDAGYLSIQDTYVGSYMTLELSGILDWTASRRRYA